MVTSITISFFEPHLYQSWNCFFQNEFFSNRMILHTGDSSELKKCDRHELLRKYETSSKEFESYADIQVGISSFSMTSKVLKQSLLTFSKV